MPVLRLGVFGAPERLSDHADRALAAACLLERPGELGIEERGSLPLKGKRDPVALYAATRVDVRTRGDRARLITGG